MSRYVKTRNAIIGSIYRRLLKPIFFRQDPETVHDRMTRFGVLLGRSPVTRWLTRVMFSYRHPMLEQTIAGLTFRTPVGLAAGFDKEGKLISILPDVGFGFMEIGSITGTPSPGNRKPRLWRLPKSKALVVHYGLNSTGSAAVARRLAGQRTAAPLGVSIAKANIPATDILEAGIADYRLAAEQLQGVGDYWTLNISCPNTSGGEPFLLPENFEKLLTTLKPYISQRPTFVKLPADIPDRDLNRIVDLSLDHGLTGFICTNLSKRRDQLGLVDNVIPPQGSISGKVVEPRANEVLARVYQRCRGRDLPTRRQAIIIGVGGIFTAEDAYKKIKLGASLLQLITGMVYQGPQVISEIHAGLVDLLRRDGFINIRQAVGAGLSGER